MALRVKTPAETLAVTLAEAKAHLNVEHSDDDALIASILVTAQGVAESTVQRRFVTTVMEWAPDCWPGVFPLALVNRGSVVFTYIPAGGSTYSTFARDYYTLRYRGDALWLGLKSGAVFPNVEADADEPILIEFTVGNAVDAVPETVKSAIKLHAADLYRQRETFATGLSVVPMSMTTLALLGDQIWL